MIKWGCIQPLTGGMYIGAKNAIGNDASWIISYPGLIDTKLDKSGNIASAGNEYNLVEWLKKNNCMVPYYTFEHKMFEDIDLNDVVISSPYKTVDGAPDFEGIDIVVAVPVCSGLSQVTMANDSTKDARNCNMKWITKYTLSVIKPKIYIFENAPGLISNKGAGVRSELEELAITYGYSVAYCKTDTQYHYNCQKRPRTFVVFMKWDNGVQQTPHDIQKARNQILVEDYLKQIPDSALQNDVTVTLSPLNKNMLGFFEYKYGKKWRDTINTIHFFDYIINNKLDGEFVAYVKSLDIEETDKVKISKWIDHVNDKLSRGLNYYSTAIWSYKDITPSIMFKTIQCLLHHKENRLLTIRECLHLMGMPHDFILYGNPDSNAAKIGQNVPVKTAEWIVTEAVRIVNNWNNLNDRTTESNIKIFDNTKE